MELVFSVLLVAQSCSMKIIVGSKWLELWKIATIPKRLAAAVTVRTFRCHDFEQQSGSNWLEMDLDLFRML